MIRALVRQHPQHVVLAVAVLSTLVRIHFAHAHYGFQTGDDLEVAEEAFRRALGLVHPPWRIRSLLLPDVLVAPFVAVGHALGVADPLLLATVARYPFIILSAVNILLVYRVGLRWYDSATGVAAAALYAAHWIPLVHGSSLYLRVVAVTCILSAVILLDVRTRAAGAALAGLCAALAVTARYSEAIFFGSLLVMAPWRRERLVAFAGGFAVGVCLFVGLYDRVAWGVWFGSLREFTELVFMRQDASSRVVRQPPWWYVANLLHWFPATLLPLFALAVRASEARRALAFVGLPVVALSAIFHKELRYLQGVIPFVMLISACGLREVVRLRPRLAYALLLLGVALGAARVGVAEKRSTNAVTAALWMAEQRVGHVALSQPWAYGGRLFLGNTVRITDVKIPPEPAEIRNATPDLIGIFAGDLNESVRAACADVGLHPAITFSDRGGRAVIVFARSYPAPPRPQRTVRIEKR